MINKVIKTFSIQSDAKFLAFSQEVSECMNGNTNFLSPAPTMKMVDGAVTNYSSTLAVSGRNFPKANIILKNEARRSLEDLLRQLADYVMNTAEGDAAMLESSGFTLYKKRTPVGLLPKPADVQVKPGPNKGTLKVSLKTIHRAKCYEIQYAPSGMNGNTVWQTFVGSKRITTLPDLISGTEYRIKVAGAGSNPGRVWSDEVTSFVL